jgi:hypothetical protein
VSRFTLAAHRPRNTADGRPFSDADFWRQQRGAARASRRPLTALARRRLNVLWAMLRDHRRYQPAGHAITTPAA